MLGNQRFVVSAAGAGPRAGAFRHRCAVVFLTPLLYWDALPFAPMDELKQLIREIPDWPKPGILFYDITTLMQDKDGLAAAIAGLQKGVNADEVDVVLGIEARGFFFAPTVAHEMGKGFIPVRKPKKLPWQVESIEYALEYGTDKLEIHKDAVRPGQRVLIVDDVLATGGTAAAVAQLVEKLGGKVAGFAFVIELDFLNGREKLNGYPIQSLVHY